LRVLYVDGSVEFGGSTRSLGLVLGALPHVDRTVITSQRRALARRWYAGVRLYSYRRLVNYASLSHLDQWLAARAGRLRRFARPAIGAGDSVVSAAHCARFVMLGKRLGVDLIHLNNGTGPVEATAAARLLGVPCIGHLRGFPQPPGQRGRHDRLRMRLSRTLARIIAVSDAVKNAVDPAWFPPERVVRLHDPVDVAAFDAAAAERDRVRATWGVRPDEVLVGIFGRVMRWKGQLEFVRALAAALRGDPRIRGAIVGDAADATRAYFDDVRREIHAAGIADRVILMGYQEAVEPYYHAMDVVVHASIEPEPFGMVVPEAMAARKPVVAASAGGPAEVVTDGDDGILVPPGDTAALAAAITGLAADPERRARMGERGAATVRARFGVAAIADQLAEVYRSVLAERA
jgi:glycosyltransferase involved in cell wall biosynthesis